MVYLIEANEKLEDDLKDKTLPTRLDLSVEVDGGFKAPVKMLLPPNLSEDSKYPLLVYVYGGPGSQVDLK